MPSTDSIPKSNFDAIPDVIQAFKNGEFVVVLDDPSRENEADLIIAAESVTTEQMAFMVRHSSGLICVPLTPERAATLDLPQMVTHNADPRGTAYTVSVDAEHPSVTTGISAHDRALACRMLAAPDARPDHFRRPGHVFPLRAVAGGVRARRGHTEAGVELCRLAGKRPVAVISEIVDDGHEVQGQAVRAAPGMLRGDDCVAFARRWGLKVCTIEDMIAHVEKTEGKLEMNGSG
ncbi:hypothetical protein PpBr36_08091 [Pyricularia pennisetigena]|uniref:hypothetical protein n=1 Tax=Pyricularia pennisetigena TaxID=1578925 RepID=UPI001154D818|nr:hypothetical protein PpBr36_08091 [Pyricularia pennisetigena]TLS23986.1 hypothetical protein PpBr36_08091 [Pyricularia pennisetigena]